MHEQEIQSGNKSRAMKLLDKTKWEKLIADWEKSNESQASYCDRLGLNINTFTYIRSRLQKDKHKAKFIPVTVNKVSKSIEIHDIILESSNGIKLRIPVTISKENFKQLLALIGWQHA
jgi:hypothetical protein